jgi:ATP-dependent Clp protease ATP-binding subunit ClpB
MKLDRYTNMSQAALQEAVSSALSAGHPEVVPEHLVLAVMDQTDGIGGPLLDLAGVDIDALRADLGQEVSALPHVEGGTEPRFGRRMQPLFQAAEKEAKKLKDEFISTEHFLLAASRDKEKLAEVFARAGATPDALGQALEKARGSQKVTDKDPEQKFQVLDKYTRDLTAAARQGKIDPVIGRDEEIRRVMQVLSRRTKNNPRRCP